MIQLPYPQSMLEATFSRKANRFTAEVLVQRKLVPAHIPSSGRMAELLVAGARCLLVPAVPSPTRKTAYTLAAVKTGTIWVSVDSTLPNRLIQVHLKSRQLPELSEYSLLQAEFALGHSRYDFLLSRSGRKTLVEVKSVTFVADRTAMFPDAPTARGRKHLDELTTLRQAGYNAVVIFVVQRADAEWFTPYTAIDPMFAAALSLAQRSGVEILAYNCHVGAAGVSLNAPLGILL